MILLVKVYIFWDFFNLWPNKGPKSSGNETDKNWANIEIETHNSQNNNNNNNSYKY
jgi:hypothetical protein